MTSPLCHPLLPRASLAARENLYKIKGSFSGSWPSLPYPLLPYLTSLTTVWWHFKSSYPDCKYLWGPLFWRIVLTRQISFLGKNFGLFFLGQNLSILLIMPELMRAGTFSSEPLKGRVYRHSIVLMPSTWILISKWGFLKLGLEKQYFWGQAFGRVLV